MPDTALSAAELKSFDGFYQSRIFEAGGAKDDGQELEIAQDILRAVVNDGLTPTGDGGVAYVRRGALDWSDPATLQAAQASMTPTRPVGPTPSSRKELWQGLAVLGLAILAAIWWLWPGDEEVVEPGQSPQSIVVSDGTPLTLTSLGDSLQATETPTPLPTLESELLADIIGAGVKTKELVLPRTLEIKGVSFVVQPVKTKQGEWRLPAEPRAVSWIYGTVINYVLGLEATAENKALLAGLAFGDVFLLRTSTGLTTRFAYVDTVRVAPQVTELFGQRRPGLTLVLLNDGTADSRIVIRGLYVPGSEVDSSVGPMIEPAEVNQPLVLDDRLRLTALGYALLPSAAAPAGYVYLGVNFRATYLQRGQALPATALQTRLTVDRLTYPRVTVNETQPLPEQLFYGQVVTASLTYAVPEAVMTKEMSWAVSLDPAGEQARIRLLPYAGRLQPVVTLSEAKFEGETLLLSFKVEAAFRPLDLTATDLQLQGGSLAPTGNTFPWSVAAQEQGNFTLLVRPEGAGPLTVSLLQQGFEVSY